MAWQISNWRLVETGSCVDVYCVYDIVRGLGRVGITGIQRFVLASRSEKKTSVRGESEAPEKRGESLIGVDICVANSQSSMNVG